jgi:DNA helicase INO80
MASFFFFFFKYRIGGFNFFFCLIYLQRKAAPDKQAPPKQRNPQKMASPMDYELDDSLQNSDSQAQRPKRPKRPTKSVNENLEPAYTDTLAASPEQAHYLPLTELGSADFGAEALDS